MKLSLLAILLGLVVSVPQIIGLVRPAQLAAAVRKFPRNLPLGIALMLLGSLWFVWNVSVEPISDFSVFKPYMMICFGVVVLDFETTGLSPHYGDRAIEIGAVLLDHAEDLGIPVDVPYEKLSYEQKEIIWWIPQ